MLDALAFLYDAFSGYIEDRRATPGRRAHRARDCPVPRRLEPTPVDCARIAAFLFAAGGDTTSRILATSLRILGEDADLQQQLRDDPTRIPNFVEEVLRYEGAVKADHRLTRVSTTIGGVDIPAGSVVAVLLGAANRDPRRFDDPNAFVADRPNARAHVAFGHGVHTCPGAPLAGPRPASRSNACLTGSTTSRSPRSTTARRAPGATSTSRRSCCAACAASTWSSPRGAERAHGQAVRTSARARVR